MTQQIKIIVSPFHVGIHQHRVGKGPERILAKLIPELESHQIPYSVDTLGKVDDFEGEIGRSFELLRKIAEKTAEAVKSNQFPLVLAGNCHSSAAVAAGLNEAGINDYDVFWIDAHADAQIPDDNTNGYFDSMGTSMMAGMCWKYHMSTLVKHEPLSLQNITYIAVRDCEESEKERIVSQGAHCIWGGKDGVDYVGELQQRLRERPVKRSLVHVDLDSLDPSVGHSNDYPVPGGLLAKDMIGLLDTLAPQNPTSLTVASFDPDLKNGSDIVDLAVDGIIRFLSARK